MTRIKAFAAFFATLLLLSSQAYASTITAEQKFLLNSKMGSVASKVQLGTLIDNISLGAAPLTSAKVLVGDGTNSAAQVLLSGDITNDNAGVVTIANNAVTSAKLAVNLAQYTASITVSQADLLAINTTPKQLIAAPGAGKLLVVDEIEVLHTYSTAAYATCGKVQVQYHGTTDILDLAAATITGASTKNYIARPSAYDVDNSTGSAAADMTALANKAVDFTAATADCTAGNVANLLKVRLKYRVLTLQT